MKPIIAVLLLASIIFCTNTDKEEKKKAQRELLSNPMFFFFLLGNRNPNESVECGGDLLGTVFGLNNTGINRTKLEENQEITVNYNTYWYYQSSQRTMITVTLIEGKSANVNTSVDCNKGGSIVTSYCNSIYIAGKNRKEPLLLNEPYQYEAKKDTKNFLLIDRFTIDCLAKYKVKTEALL
jgi:hypothetical protein